MISNMENHFLLDIQEIFYLRLGGLQYEQNKDNHG